MKGLHVTILILVSLISYLLLAVAAYFFNIWEAHRTVLYREILRAACGLETWFMTKINIYIVWKGDGGTNTVWGSKDEK